MPRIHCQTLLASGDTLALPPSATRHVQVLRMQPGDSVTLFNGEGGEFEAQIERMGRGDVTVVVGAYCAVERETRRAIHLVVGMPANERMDWLVEKAAELGVASIQPVLAQRSVLRLQGERAEKKQSHWQAVAIAACEQSGRNRIPQVHAVIALSLWTSALDRPTRQLRLLLSLAPQSQPVASAAGGDASLLLLSGPEGGLTLQEEEQAVAAGFQRATLGPRVLRAETAPLAALAALTLAR